MNLGDELELRIVVLGLRPNFHFKALRVELPTQTAYASTTHVRTHYPHQIERSLFGKKSKTT